MIRLKGKELEEMEGKLEDLDLKFEKLENEIKEKQVFLLVLLLNIPRQRFLLQL